MDNILETMGAILEREIEALEKQLKVLEELAERVRRKSMPIQQRHSHLKDAQDRLRRALEWKPGAWEEKEEIPF